MIKIKKGLDLPITGSPKQEIHIGPAITQVALLGEDYIDMKASMHIRIDHQVKCGDLMWTDKKNDGVRYTAPASGKIVAINRGAKRKLLSVVIEIEGDESVEFEKTPHDQLSSIGKESITERLNQAGLWAALRTRPNSKVPVRGGSPVAIFVSIMDSNPLSADPQVIIKEKESEFNHGLTVLKQLTEGDLFVSYDGNQGLKIEKNEIANYQAFAGVHPVGNVGTHIHFLKPVNANREVWHINYQEVITIGELFVTGRLNCDRVIAIAGPLVKEPRLIRTKQGANVDELLKDQINPSDERVISGSVFNGHIAVHHRAFLGRYHNQISVLAEGRDKELFGWLHAGVDKFSVTNAFISHLNPSKTFDLNTSTHGSERAIMPIGSYERVMPWDILPTQLIRAIVVGDTDDAQELGCLEFDEEDLALCTFVCPGKYEYGPILRDVLTTIEKEG
ncbi:MAG: NADH:ubiquinone reductase (Na(+)-transporting) subunit A [Gammaproteobacteria bacterium]|nr:MAG: NADH:ubiquinone reductase (Na(+)-transporting) subunit A [Gammaproteobacteria bacterium]